LPSQASARASYLFAGLLVAAFNTELYRFPLVVSTRTFAYERRHADIPLITA
jgi:hypothetical protein